MIYQLSSGRTVELSVEQYLDMSDEELKYLDTYGVGDPIEDPWHGSVLTKGTFKEELADELYIMDSTEVTIEEKLIDLDIDPDIGEI